MSSPSVNWQEYSKIIHVVGAGSKPPQSSQPPDSKPEAMSATSGTSATRLPAVEDGDFNDDLLPAAGDPL